MVFSKGRVCFDLLLTSVLPLSFLEKSVSVLMLDLLAEELNYYFYCWQLCSLVLHHPDATKENRT